MPPPLTTRTHAIVNAVQKKMLASQALVSRQSPQKASLYKPSAKTCLAIVLTNLEGHAHAHSQDILRTRQCGQTHMVVRSVSLEGQLQCKAVGSTTMHSCSSCSNC